MPHADAVQIFPAVGGPSRRWVLVLDTAAHDSRLPRSFLVHFLRVGHGAVGAGLEQRRRDDLNRVEKDVFQLICDAYSHIYLFCVKE